MGKADKGLGNLPLVAQIIVLLAVFLIGLFIGDEAALKRCEKQKAKAEQKIRNLEAELRKCEDDTKKQRRLLRAIEGQQKVIERKDAEIAQLKAKLNEAA